jgi:hypothetical protein
MNQSQSQINSLLIIVALLAVVGGLTIVIVMSPQSWELGPAAWLQGPPPTLTPVPPSATPPPTGTPTATVITPTPAASATATATTLAPTETPTVDLSATAVLTGTEAAGSPVPATPGPVVTSNNLPEDVFGLAVVTLSPGATSGRLRDTPNGETILAAVPNDTNLQVLFGRIEADGNMWVQVRLEDGTEGWMAEFLLRYTVRRP